MSLFSLCLELLNSLELLPETWLKSVNAETL